MNASMPDKVTPSFGKGSDDAGTSIGETGRTTEVEIPVSMLVSFGAFLSISVGMEHRMVGTGTTVDGFFLS